MTEKDDRAELELSINQANSLKQMTGMAGWKIIDEFLKGYEEESLSSLRDTGNKDLADIQSCRKIIEFIQDFRDLFNYTEISAQNDEQELKRIGGK